MFSFGNFYHKGFSFKRKKYSWEGLLTRKMIGSLALCAIKESKFVNKVANWYTRRSSLRIGS